MAGMRKTERPRLIALACFLAAGGVTEGRADRILLRGGAQIRGVVIPSPDRPEQVLVQTETLVAPIKYRKDQVVQVIPEPSVLQDYLERRDRTGQGAEARYELGRWCEDRKLSEFASLHYHEAIEADETFGPAHEELGHVLHEGRWLTADELREAQGLVKHKGRWISREELEKIETETAGVAEQASWARRIAVLRSAMIHGSPDRRQEAEVQLTAIHDPAAVPALVKVFGGEPEPSRILLARILGGIQGPEAASALVARLLAEGEADVRQALMNELTLRDDPVVVPQLLRALRSRDLAVVNRAAWCLGNLREVAAVPKLVQALVSVEQKIVWEPTSNGKGGGGAGPGAGFVSVAPSPGSSYAEFGTITPIPVLTPPVVGPGVVAYGGTSVPFGTGVGLSIGDPPGLSRGYQPRFVRNAYRNVQVLDALERLTGQHFGYDQPAWRRWLKTSFRPEPEPARRVPQP